MKVLSHLLFAIFLSPLLLANEPPEAKPEMLFATASKDIPTRDRALADLESQWTPAYVPMILDLISVSTSASLNRYLIDLLERKTGIQHGYNTWAWQEWLWAQETLAGETYPRFKSLLLGRIDPRMGAYFAGNLQSRIRLDEIVWGGVKQDGIPPLRNPAMIRSRRARYLDDDDIVFAVSINGDQRAYPQRILAWHEMFTDSVGGVPIAGVYCTLCGSMIVYRTEIDGKVHRLGTSGLLYRSNKLMYDQETQSLWSTLRGEPVVGALANSGIQLERLPVITTTWKAWKRLHPDTRVLSLETGHRRDYSEGAAYRDYFATDDLMFPVPKTDRRLANKDPILGLLLDGSPVALSVRFLADHPVYRVKVGERQVTILTDKSGASRAYETLEAHFEVWEEDRGLIDAEGGEWKVEEDFLEAGDGTRLHRLPAHRAFWFGWYASFPRTRLID